MCAGRGRRCVAHTGSGASLDYSRDGHHEDFSRLESGTTTPLPPRSGLVSVRIFSTLIKKIKKKKKRKRSYSFVIVISNTQSCITLKLLDTTLIIPQEIRDRTIRGVDYSNCNGNLRLPLARYFEIASPLERVNLH